MFFSLNVLQVTAALTALERLLELLDLPHEPAWRVPSVDDHLPPRWPATVHGRKGGAIEFCGASLRCILAARKARPVISHDHLRSPEI